MLEVDRVSVATDTVYYGGLAEKIFTSSSLLVVMVDTHEV